MSPRNTTDNFNFKNTVTLFLWIIEDKHLLENNCQISLVVSVERKPDRNTKYNKNLGVANVPIVSKPYILHVAIELTFS